MGGFAVLTWGVPRATFDADVLLQGDDEELSAFLESCVRRGFQVDDEFRRGWRDTLQGMDLIKVRLFRGGRPVTADIFVVSTPLQGSAMGRVVQVAVPGLGRTVPVISAADLLLFKLLANRQKDRLDIQNVLCVQGIPDQEYLRDWAIRLGILDRLEEALRQSPPA